MTDNTESVSTIVSDRRRGGFQNTFAMTVFVVSVSGIGLFGSLAILIGKANAEQVFQSTLPLFGTWVGTVLAFYFSRQNFESASDSLNRVVHQLTPEQRLRSVAVRQVMMPRASITSLALTGGQGDADIPLSSLVTPFSDRNVTRLPIFNADGSIRYVIHEGIFSKYQAQVGAAAAINGMTLADLLAYSIDGERVAGLAKLFAFVQVDGTLADAQAELRSVARAQDVFVTAGGTANEPVVGWITNAVIARNL